MPTIDPSPTISPTTNEPGRPPVSARLSLAGAGIIVVLLIASGRAVIASGGSVSVLVFGALAGAVAGIAGGRLLLDTVGADRPSERHHSVRRTDVST